MLYLTGEPVAGAEIYVELSPGDEPLINLPDSAGYEIWEITTKPNTNLNSYLFSISLHLNEKCFYTLSKNNKRFIAKGIYLYGLETIVLQKKYVNQFIVVANEPIFNLTNSFSSGPFSQSLSNIEDNGKLINPNKLGKVKIATKLYRIAFFSSVK